MSRRKTPPLECFRNSLVFSLGEAIQGHTEKQVRLGTWTISAPVWELPAHMHPRDMVEILVDVEFDSPSYTRLAFELEYQYLNRLDPIITAVYIARCENF